MNRIDDLIARECPNGVPFYALRDVGVWHGGGTPSKHRSDFWDNGTIPWLSPKDMGRPVVSVTEDRITEVAVTGSATKLLPANTVALVARSSILDRILPVALVPMPVTLNQDMKAVVVRDDVLPEYLANLLRAQGPSILRAVRKTGGSVASLEFPKLLAWRIPVPPLVVQRALVGILNELTQLEEELEAVLHAELSARRQQYVHYRDALLSFPDSSGGG